MKSDRKAAAHDLDIEVAQFFAELRHFQKYNIDAIESLLAHLAQHDENAKLRTERIALLKNTLKRIMAAQSVEELALYQESFVDILSDCKVNSDDFSIDECKAHVNALSEATSSILNTESEHINAAMLDVAKTGFLTAMSNLPITHPIYVAASYIIPAGDTVHELTSNTFEEPKPKLTLGQRIKEYAKDTWNSIKNNPKKTALGLVAAGLLIGAPYVFLPAVAATAAVLTGAVILGIVEGARGILSRAVREKDRQDNLDKRLNEHQDDLDKYSGVVNKKVIKTSEPTTKLNAVFSALVTFSKKHPWSTPFVALAATAGAFFGWKFVAVAAVMTGTKATVIGSTLTALKTLGSASAAGGASLAANKAQGKLSPDHPSAESEEKIAQMRKTVENHHKEITKKVANSGLYKQKPKESTRTSSGVELSTAKPASRK